MMTTIEFTTATLFRFLKNVNPAVRYGVNNQIPGLKRPFIGSKGRLPVPKVRINNYPTLKMDDILYIKMKLYTKYSV